MRKACVSMATSSSPLSDSSTYCCLAERRWASLPASPESADDVSLARVDEGVVELSRWAIACSRLALSCDKYVARSPLCSDPRGSRAVSSLSCQGTWLLDRLMVLHTQGTPRIPLTSTNPLTLKSAIKISEKLQSFCRHLKKEKCHLHIWIMTLDI